MNTGPQKLGDIFNKTAKQQTPKKKPPAHEWQDFALKIIDELKIPGFKRNSVFLICKKYPKIFIEKCLNDTKELVQTGEKWRYFFKLVESKK